MKYAYELISQTQTSFFLTGRAGTGKTTFIKHVLETVDKKFIVLAPTGIAALNAGGQTIHSFFGFHLGVLGPHDPISIPARSLVELNGDPFSPDPRPADAIIIDEISMVRCDVLDAIDRALRRDCRSSAPFGGMQMIFVGDLFQLEPVVTESDRRILEEFYGDGDYHFFSARAINEYTLPKIELTKVFRQTEQEFLCLLNRVRIGEQDRSDILALNERVSREATQNALGLEMNLTAYRADADRINENMMARLNGPPRVYEAIYEGECESIMDAVDRLITLKAGAQVVFIKNGADGMNGSWVNGTMGIVTGLQEDSVKVKLEDGCTVNVKRAEWEVFEYVYDKTLRRNNAVHKGGIKQLPLKAAWAITIHRSQSMTYSNAVVDFGRGAFGAGQAYVALSRVRSLDGLTLTHPITSSSIITDANVLAFSQGINDPEQVRMALLADAADSYLDDGDFDGYASALFDLVAVAAGKGEYYLADLLLSRLYVHLADDRHLVYQGAIDESEESLAVPALMLYSGRAEEALRWLEKHPACSDEFNIQYLRIRCYEELQQWSNFEFALDDLLLLCETDIEHNASTCHHRKVLWTAILHPERINPAIVAAGLTSLVYDVGMYPPFYAALRKAVFTIPSFREAFIQSREPVAVMMADRSLKDDRVLSLLKDSYYLHEEEWDRFVKVVESLKSR